MEYLPKLFARLFGYKTPRKNLSEDVLPSKFETPLQIISEKNLWEEIISTYPNESFDRVNFHEYHAENNVVHYFETSPNFKFNLQTLKPCKESLLQDHLHPRLVSKIKNNEAYRKFSEEKISFSDGNHGWGSFDLTDLQCYLDYYFKIDYDDKKENDYQFRRLRRRDRVNLIKHKHQDILNNCKGLRSTLYLEGL
jgi:hypothetical protein